MSTILPRAPMPRTAARSRQLVAASERTTLDPFREIDWSVPIDDSAYHLPPELLPRTECLADVLHRMLPYWYDAIVPDLAANRTVLVVAHGNSLRALVKHLDEIGDGEIAGLNIPTGIPLVYELDKSFRPVLPGGTYLDPEAASAAAEAVRNQGR